MWKVNWLCWGQYYLDMLGGLGQKHFWVLKKSDDMALDRRKLHLFSKGRVWIKFCCANENIWFHFLCFMQHYAPFCDFLLLVTFDKELLNMSRPVYRVTWRPLSLTTYDIHQATPVFDVLYDMIDSIFPCRISLFVHVYKLANSLYEDPA